MPPDDGQQEFIVDLFGSFHPPLRGLQFGNDFIRKPESMTLGRAAVENGIGRNVFGYDGVGPDDSTIADFHAIHDDAACTDPDVVTDHDRQVFLEA